MATEIASDNVTSSTAVPSPSLKRRGGYQSEPGQTKRRKTPAENASTNTRLSQKRGPPINRINIVHSFGKVTTHDVSNELKLSELFILHHSHGGRKPCRGLALQQRGRSEFVGGLRYWVSAEGPIHKYFWDERSTTKISETDWTFVEGKAWLACTYDGQRR